MILVGILVCLMSLSGCKVNTADRADQDAAWEALEPVQNRWYVKAWGKPPDSKSRVQARKNFDCVWKESSLSDEARRADVDCLIRQMEHLTACPSGEDALTICIADARKRCQLSASFVGATKRCRLDPSVALEPDRPLASEP